MVGANKTQNLDVSPGDVFLRSSVQKLVVRKKALTRLPTPYGVETSPYKTALYWGIMAAKFTEISSEISEEASEISEEASEIFRKRSVK